MHIFGRNDQNVWKLTEVRAGPTQIDPRGHDAIGICDICWVVCADKSKEMRFFHFPGAGNEHFRSERSIPVTKWWTDNCFGQIDPRGFDGSRVRSIRSYVADPCVYFYTFWIQYIREIHNVRPVCEHFEKSSPKWGPQQLIWASGAHIAPWNQSWDCRLANACKILHKDTPGGDSFRRFRCIWSISRTLKCYQNFQNLDVCSKRCGDVYGNVWNLWPFNSRHHHGFFKRAILMKSKNLNLWNCEEVMQTNAGMWSNSTKNALLYAFQNVWCASPGWNVTP